MGEGRLEKIESPSGPGHERNREFIRGFLGDQEPRPLRVMEVVRDEVLGEVSGVLFWSPISIKLACIQRVQLQTGSRL